ncbi:MAG: AIPR protein [Nitrospiraceae bacterium]|nr:MAG: AIPR protein [Nitrospiraceae bacterium]
MDAQEFRKDFIEGVKAEAAATGEGSSASFVSAFAQYLQEAEFLMDFTAAYFEGTGKRNRKMRVDGYAYDEFDKTMSLIIADYDASENERVLARTQAGQLQERLSTFVDHALNSTLHREVEMSRPCSDLVDLLREKRREIRKYQLLIFTTASISTTITVLESVNIDGVPSECQIWDINRLFKVCGSDTGRNIIEIDFKAYSKHGIPCMEASGTETKDFKSYLCIIPGVLLADIYDKYGSGLLEGNIRSFLSTKVAVNKKIRATILQCPERFFAYNNGISATAMDIKIESTSEGQFLVSAKDFQIINGGQTTASLSNARFRDKANLSTIYVQMKLTVIESTLEEEATELVQNISRSSNSQNKVSDADFFSTHPFHVRMERFSQRLYARAVGGLQHETKWFYERARGQYLQKQMRMTPGEKKKFLLQNPKNQLITKTDLAKVRNTWKGLPHTVSRGAQTNFAEFAKTTSDEWEASDDGLVFNEKYFQESVALVLIFRYCEKMVTHQPWYSQGYRANIVTYTISLLHMLIQKQFPGKDLDLMNIWTRQNVPDAVSIALTELSELVYDKLTDPKRGVENVTQWCKQEGCWKSVQSIECRLSPDIEACLIGRDELKVAEREAKYGQRIDSETEIMTKIINISQAQWQNALNFATGKRMITPDEHTAMRIACLIPQKMPTPAQCKRLIAVLERLEEEGFKL